MSLWVLVDESGKLFQLLTDVVKSNGTSKNTSRQVNSVLTGMSLLFKGYLWAQSAKWQPHCHLIAGSTHSSLQVNPGIRHETYKRMCLNKSDYNQTLIR